MASQEKMPIEKKKCMTPKFRVSYPSVFKAKSYEGNEPKYSCVMLFDKTTDLKELKRAAFNAAVEKFGPREKWPKRLRMPFRSGNEDRPDTPGYQDCTFVTATSKQRPGIVDRQRNPIIAEEEFYAGCYARATLIAFAYDTKGNVGVSFALQNLQKWAEGEKFGGRRAAEDEFETIDDGSDDASNYEDAATEIEY